MSIAPRMSHTVLRTPSLVIVLAVAVLLVASGFRPAPFDPDADVLSQAAWPEASADAAVPAYPVHGGAEGVPPDLSLAPAPGVPGVFREWSVPVPQLGVALPVVPVPGARVRMPLPVSGGVLATLVGVVLLVGTANLVGMAMARRSRRIPCTGGVPARRRTM